MSKAAQVTYGDFRRVSGFFYDDFYKAVYKIGNTPVISTKHFKNSLQKYVKLINNGTIKGVASPQKDAIYQYAKKNKKIPEYITATQYKSLKEDLKYFARLSKKDPFNIKVLTGNVFKYCITLTIWSTLESCSSSKSSNTSQLVTL